MDIFNIDIAIECFKNGRDLVSSSAEEVHSKSALLQKSTTDGDKRSKGSKSKTRSYASRPPSTESPLPIDSHRESLLRKINEDRVIIIHGEVIFSK